MEGVKNTKKPELDVYSAFSPMFHASRLLGVFPVTSRRHRSGRVATYERSVMAHIYSFLLILTGMLLVLASYSDATQMFSDLATDEEENRKSLFVNKVEYFITFVISLANIIFGLTCSYRIRSIFVGLSKADGILKAPLLCGGLRPRYRFFRSIAALQVVVVILGSITSGYIDFFTFGKRASVHWTIMPFYFVRLLSFCLEQQFILVALMFRERFVLVNSSLQRSFLNPAFPWFVSSKNVFDRCSNWRNQRVRPSGGGDVLHSFECNAEIIEKLRLTHAVLSEEISTVNRAYELPLITDILMLFFDFMAGGYFLITGLLDGNQKRAWTSAWSWVINSSVRIAILSWIAWDTAGKAKMAGPLIVKLMKRKTDIEMREELIIFLEQLSRNEVRFNLLGLFYLDMTLPQALTQAATSYLLVLVQFKTSE